ncbi:hypothetical protein GM415_01885 [Pseudodesulfovibrio cashew]|uniref:Uncharacterized protein n=1 Tax=Pseudodesulfovibrio cashew TaxID=2678688 RepID=A0A6I6JFY2_9BACT|nr:hypothetical protein [Pseudodesulfovibrio cashew]QGY38937.1 hypothetical protein GM415_01885 [Pseudodesulfovibrio cashew]
MYQLGRIVVLVIVASLGFSSCLLAADMSQGLTCPPGWNDNVSARGNDLLKQCVSPSQDAFIELYSSRAQDVPLGKLLDAWAAEMTRRGLPFQNLVSEQPGQISGYPAVTRVYSGHINNGAQFDSSLVASHYNGMCYVFQGLSLKGREQARQQVRHAMNTWYYPGASPRSSGNSNALPLGAGSSSGKSHNGVSGGGLPAISGTFISDSQDYWGGNHYYRIYHFYGNGTYIDGTKNAKTGQVKMGNRRQTFKVSKSGNSYVVKGKSSCTEGYVTDTEGNAVTRFKSGCYSSGGKAMYFRQATGNASLNKDRVKTTGTPTIAGTFIADKKDYWAGSYHYRMYQFNGDGTYVEGSKNAASGKVKMDTKTKRCKISKSGNYYVVSGKGSCTDGYVTDTAGNKIVRFKSGCYSSGGKAMYFELVR